MKKNSYKNSLVRQNQSPSESCHTKIICNEKKNYFLSWINCFCCPVSHIINESTKINISITNENQENLYLSKDYDKIKLIQTKKPKKSSNSNQFNKKNTDSNDSILFLSNFVNNKLNIIQNEDYALIAKITLKNFNIYNNENSSI